MTAEDILGMGELEIEVSKLGFTFLYAGPELKPHAESIWVISVELMTSTYLKMW